MFGVWLVALAGCSPDAVTLVPGKTEVVIAADAPKSVEFAAAEMTNFLSHVLGRPVGVVNRPSGSNAAVFLGDNAWSRAEGLDPKKPKRDGFFIRASERGVFIVGADDSKADLAAIIRNGRVDGPAAAGVIKKCGEHATLFGVYEFLHRYAACRFYFAHELGTIVPAKSSVEIPFGTYLREPAWTERNIYLNADGVWPGETGANTTRTSPKCLNWLRLKLQTRDVISGHGFNCLQFSRRFGKAHPDWFYLRKVPGGDGYERDPHGKSPNQMCWSNPAVWDQMFDDVMAYWRGEDAAPRGIVREWNSDARGWGPFVHDGFVDLSPQDGMRACQCERCRAACDESRRPLGWASDYMWPKWAAFAKRLADEGCPYVMMTSAYAGWTEPPKCSLPSNMAVEVSVQGPWSWGNKEVLAREAKAVRTWAEKLGHKVWTCTYPAKHPEFSYGIPGVPDIAPKAWGGYYRMMSNWAEGSFCESECERSLLHYLNYYVFSRLAWDPDADLDALLDDHYALMFGAGAAEIKAFFEMCEEKWINRITGTTVDTDLGPDPRAPSRPEIWKNIWNADAIACAESLFAAAAAKTAADPLASARVALMKREILDPLVRAHTANLDALSVEKAKARRAARKIVNLFEDGAFSDGAKGWSLDRGVSLDMSEFVSAPAALKFTKMDPKGTSAARQKRAAGFYKPNTRYRISFFVKLDGVKRLVDCGRSCWFTSYDGRRWYCHPGGNEFLQGTADWFYCEREFKTDDFPAGMDAKQYIGFELDDQVVGTAWIDDIVLEELP